MNPAISIVVPAYNEEKTIAAILDRIHEAFKSIKLSYEIIVVDDGSTDKTKMCVHSLDAKVISNGKNQGKGSALRRGFHHAKGNIIVTIDADGSHDPADILRLVSPIMNGTDVVMGSRFAGGHGRASTRRLHILGNFIINLLIRIITHKAITDSQTGFRVLRREIVDQIRIVSQGYQVETEITVKTLKNGNKVREVPIKSEKRREGQSSLSPLRDGFKIFKTILVSAISP